MDAMVYHCYVVTSISSNFEDALDATFQQPFQSTSSTLWMLRCNTHFEQLGRHFGCYVPTAIWINFQDTMDATVYHSYVVTSISSNFEDALDVTFQEPFQATSRTLWMLRCKIHFEQLGRHFEVTRWSGSFQLLLIWPSVPFCRLAWSHESNFVWGKPSKQVAIGNVLSGLLLKSAWKRMALRRCVWVYRVVDTWWGLASFAWKMWEGSLRFFFCGSVFVWADFQTYGSEAPCKPSIPCNMRLFRALAEDFWAQPRGSHFLGAESVDQYSGKHMQ